MKTIFSEAKASSWQLSVKSYFENEHSVQRKKNLFPKSSEDEMQGRALAA